MIGAQLGPYEIIEEVGRGGMAAVYRARQASIERDVAIKIILGAFGEDEQAIIRFQREARLIARLEHPHILPVHDFDGAHRPPYIVMRYLDGGTLKDFLQRGQLQVDEALYILRQIGSALDYAHRQGVVHRDIKPSNIMIDRDGNAFVTDFGIARMTVIDGQQITSPGAMLGTPDYISPEQVRGESDLDYRADIYSLGVVSFQMLSGRLPFQGNTPMSVVVKHLHDPLPNITEFKPELPQEVNTIIRKALAKDREERYSSIITFIDDLSHVLGKTVMIAPDRLRQVAQQVMSRREFESQRALKKEGDSRSTPFEQNKTVTVLYANAAEYAEIVDAARGPEASRRAIKALWDAVTLIIGERSGKVLERSEGDLLAVWGVETASEDDAVQAVYAALEVLTALRDQGWAVLSGDEDKEALPIKVGIHSGLALLVFENESGAWSASGGPVNLAQRLADHAEGDILISKDTFRSVQGLFDVLPRDPLRMRGRKDTLPVYQILNAKMRSLRKELRSVEGVATSMVGRDGELKQLQNAYLDAVEEHETQLVTITAEAGMGKSRLLYEFSQWSELRKELFWVLRGRATLASINHPYALLRDIVSFRYEILKDDSPTAIEKKLTRGVAEQTGLDAEIAHLLGHLCGYDMSAGRYLGGLLGDPVQLGIRARQAGLLFLERLAENGPVVAELEDIHYADIASLELISELLRKRHDVPLIMIALARPSIIERYPAWGAGVRFHTRINLQPLGRRESRDLVAEILQKASEVPRELRDLLVERGEGNPLYLEELIKMMVEDHIVLKETPDVWRVEASRLENLRVPPTLVGVLQARFDSLLYPEKVVLQRASAIGRVFYDSLIDTLERADDFHIDNLDQILSGLEQREFINSRKNSSFAGSREYIFRQNMLRDQIYETLLERQRISYHQQIAEWLVMATAERAGEYAPLIAQHYENSGQIDRAIEYLYLAGKQASERGLLAEAASLLEHAVLLMSQCEHPLNLGIRLLLADALVRGSDLTLAANLLSETLEIARNSGSLSAQAHTLFHLSQVENHHGNWQAALELLSQALPLARASGDDSALGWVLYGLGDTTLRIGDSAEALTYSEEALEIARRLGDRVLERISLNRQGTSYVELNQYSEAIVTYQELLALAHSASDQHAIVAALINLGQVFWYAGDAQASTNYTLQALALSQNQDIPYLVASINMARNYALMGEVEKAWPMVHNSVTRALKVGAQAWTVGVVGWAGIVRAASGDVPGGLAMVGLACSSSNFAIDSRRELLNDVDLLNLKQYTQEQIQQMIQAGENLDVMQVIQELLPEQI